MSFYSDIVLGVSRIMTSRRSGIVIGSRSLYNTPISISIDSSIMSYIIKCGDYGEDSISLGKPVAGFFKDIAKAIAY